MNGTPHTPGLGDERGFTLVELLVAMTMSILILFGILNTLDNFSSNAARQTRVTDANDQVRKAMDRIVSRPPPGGDDRGRRPQQPRVRRQRLHERDAPRASLPRFQPAAVAFERLDGDDGRDDVPERRRIEAHAADLRQQREQPAVSLRHDLADGGRRAQHRPDVRVQRRQRPQQRRQHAACQRVQAQQGRDRDDVAGHDHDHIVQQLQRADADADVDAPDRSPSNTPTRRATCSAADRQARASC